MFSYRLFSYIRIDETHRCANAPTTLTLPVYLDYDSTESWPTAQLGESSAPPAPSSPPSPSATDRVLSICSGSPPSSPRSSVQPFRQWAEVRIAWIEFWTYGKRGGHLGRARKHDFWGGVLLIACLMKFWTYGKSGAVTFRKGQKP